MARTIRTGNDGFSTGDGGQVTFSFEPMYADPSTMATGEEGGTPTTLRTGEENLLGDYGGFSAVADPFGDF